MSEHHAPYELPSTYVAGKMTRHRVQAVVGRALQFWRRYLEKPNRYNLELEVAEWEEIKGLVEQAIEGAANHRRAIERSIAFYHANGRLPSNAELCGLLSSFFSPHEYDLLQPFLKRPVALIEEEKKQEAAKLAARKRPSTKSRSKAAAPAVAATPAQRPSPRVTTTPQAALGKRIGALPEAFQKIQAMTEFGLRRWAYLAVVYYLEKGGLPQHFSLARTANNIVLSREEYKTVIRHLRPLVLEHEKLQQSQAEPAEKEREEWRDWTVTEHFLFEGLDAVGIPDRRPDWTDQQVYLLARLMHVKPSNEDRRLGRQLRERVWDTILANNVPFVGVPHRHGDLERLSKLFRLKTGTSLSPIKQKLSVLRSIVDGTHGHIRMARKPHVALYPGQEGWQDKFEFGKKSVDAASEESDAAAADA